MWPGLQNKLKYFRCDGKLNPPQCPYKAARGQAVIFILLSTSPGDKYSVHSTTPGAPSPLPPPLPHLPSTNIVYGCQSPFWTCSPCVAGLDCRRAGTIMIVSSDVWLPRKVLSPSCVTWATLAGWEEFILTGQVLTRCLRYGGVTGTPGLSLSIIARLLTWG